MKSSLRLSRRHLTSGLALLPAASILALRGNAATAVAGSLAQWQPTDGLRIAGSITGPASLDPALSRDLSTNFLLRQVFRGLVALDGELKPTLELAESVETAEDGLSHTFTLRDSARFHDGRAITAEDVVLSLSRALNPGIADGNVERLAAITYLGDIAGAAEMIAGESDQISGIDVTGDRTLTISLSRPSPTFLMKLASVPASIVDGQQATAAAEWWRLPNGSGPFSVTSWEHGVGLELEAAATWWAGIPALASVSVRLGSSASQPLNLFQGGEIDMVNNVPADLVSLIVDPASGVEYGEVLESRLFATSFIAFGNTVPPLDDVHLRRALQLAFPGDQVADATFNGEVIAASGLIPPGMLGEVWETDRTAANGDAARAELGRSRYGSGAEVPMISIFGADIDQIEALRDLALEKLGVRIEAIRVNWPDFLNGLSERRFPAYSLYWGADYPDPEAMIDMLFGAESADNYTGYDDPELESLLDEARTTGGAERIAAYAAANQLLIDNGALIPLYHAVGYALVRNGISGLKLTPMGILGLESINAVQ